MTVHQVNLYKSEFRPRRQLLSFSQILGLWLVVMGISGAMNLLLAYYSELQAGAVLIAAQQSERLNRSIDQLTHEIEHRSSDDALERANARLRLRIEQGSELVRFLDSRQLSFDGTGSLSGVMTGFARQAGDGIWLDRIDLVDAGLTLSGFVDTPARLPEYLKRLGREPTLEGRHFDNLSVTALAGQGTDRLAFRLSSVEEVLAPGVAQR